VIFLRACIDALIDTVLFFTVIYFIKGFKMALILTKNDGVIKVISSKDQSVCCDEDVYAEYQKTLNEDLLKMDGEPTRFVLKKGLNYREQQVVKDAQVKMDGKKLQITLSYMMEEVRIALIDIENPENLPEDQKIKYKKTEDGKTDRELIAMLESAGIVTELFAARQGSLGVLTEEVKKK
jgi:hypothetical protein